MAFQPPLEGGRGREALALHVFSAAEPEPHDLYELGAQTTTIMARTLAQLRARYGGDEFDIRNPTTGKRHHVRLHRYADHDPDTTFVQFRFHFYPAPFASREAQVLQQRARNELRRLHELMIAIKDDPKFEHAWDNVPEGLPRTRDENIGATKGRKLAFEDFATRIGLLTHDEIAAINNEYAIKRPDLFLPY